MNNRMEFISGAFWENGYALIRNVFDREEIEVLRKHAYQSRLHKGDLLSNPLLRRVILDDRVLDIAGKILGDTPVYFGDSNCVIGEKSHGYHKDNADRTDIKAPDWQSKYTLIRFGLYLQDHSKHSGGLNVRAQSHNFISAQKGKNVYLATSPGDLVVWNLRTSHSGNGHVLKVMRGLHLDPRIADRLPRFLFSSTDRERVALFFTFGLDDQHLKRYITYLKTRAYMVSTWRNSEYNDAVWHAITGKALIVKDVWKDIREEAELGMNEFYIPIPY